MRNNIFCIYKKKNAKFNLKKNKKTKRRRRIFSITSSHTSNAAAKRLKIIIFSISSRARFCGVQNIYKKI